MIEKKKRTLKCWISLIFGMLLMLSSLAGIFVPLALGKKLESFVFVIFWLLVFAAFWYLGLWTTFMATLELSCLQRDEETEFDKHEHELRDIL